MTRRLITACAVGAIVAAICSESGVGFRNMMLICTAVGVLMAITPDRKDKP